MAGRRRHRKRGRNLTDNDVNTILKIIDGWTGPLMWSLLIEELEKRVHSHYTRQALHRHERILHAFQEKKVSLRNRPTSKRNNQSVEVQLLVDTNGHLEAENERLKSENERLLEQFVVWAYNARIRGGDEKNLRQPLPPVTREPDHVEDT